jgi:hypothetical protein
MVQLSRFFEWRTALLVVEPETFRKWHRTAFRASWNGSRGNEVDRVYQKLTGTNSSRRHVNLTGNALLAPVRMRARPIPRFAKWIRFAKSNFRMATRPLSPHAPQEALHYAAKRPNADVFTTGAKARRTIEIVHRRFALHWRVAVCFALERYSEGTNQAECFFRRGISRVMLCVSIPERASGPRSDLPSGTLRCHRRYRRNLPYFYDLPRKVRRNPGNLGHPGCSKNFFNCDPGLAGEHAP